MLELVDIPLEGLVSPIPTFPPPSFKTKTPVPVAPELKYEFVPSVHNLALLVFVLFTTANPLSLDVPDCLIVTNPY